ncbi:hypothetical protein [Neotabrizicola sp. VNH66]|uniref:hypothetical protein n=1 Tax=Neotabrizicola sp. VNH66 TaxID=3400918 RepID=UPI003C028C5D
MNRKIVALLTATALALPLSATAQDAMEPTVKEIDVTVDLAAVQNPAAAAYWGTLEADLEAAILARLTGHISDDGAKIGVDISEVELASGFAEAAGLADAMLKGVVNQSHDSNNARFNSYELTVDYKASMPILGEGFDITAPDVDTKRVYTAMVDTFADNVVKNLK